jgi:hypothetical protein
VVSSSNLSELQRLLSRELNGEFESPTEDRAGNLLFVIRRDSGKVFCVGLSANFVAVIEHKHAPLTEDAVRQLLDDGGARKEIEAARPGEAIVIVGESGAWMPMGRDRWPGSAFT